MKQEQEVAKPDTQGLMLDTLDQLGCLPTANDDGSLAVHYQREIETWLSNIQELSEFRYYSYGEPSIIEDPWCSADEYDDPLSPFCLTQFWKSEYYEPHNILIFYISDVEGRGITIDIPLDGITSPSAGYYDLKLNKSVEVELDLSIIDYIQSLIERFPDKFFRDHLQAAIYYSQNNTLKAIDELRSSIESDDPYNFEHYKRYFPLEFRESDAFKELLKQSSKRYKG